MKTKLSTVCLRDTNSLNVCQKSSIISKKSCSHVKVSQQMAELCVCIQDCHRVSLSTEVSTQEIQIHEAIDYQQLLEESFQFQKQPSVFVDSSTMGRMESAHTCSSNLETIFSPVMEPIEVLGEPCTEINAGTDDIYEEPRVGTDDSNDNKMLCDYQTCSVSDFYISDILIASIPFKGNAVDDDITETSSFPEEQCAEPSVMLDVAEHYMVLPYLEDTIKISNSNDAKACDEAIICVGDANPYLAIDPMRFCNQESDVNSYADSDQAECFDPHLYIKNFPELSDVVSNFCPSVLPKDTPKRKVITLVLDLDETLVHSTLEHCDDADFTFTVFFNMEEHTVYVKQRPHLQTFLERVAEMFEVAIFTASQSIYAEQLLDILDPDKKLISFRAYRESCIFSDGSYTKDLTVLGVDLAKIAIIDNSPQVFRLQVNNGIPIKSWFDDPSDSSLISLLPFLETLVDADDVRPIIAKRFGNKE